MVANALYPTFSNFTVIRLSKNETPPPWNATAFLHIEKKCANHPYVVESIERRNRSPFLVASNRSAHEMEHDYDLSLWVHGVHWPAFSANSNKYLRVIRDRPAIIGMRTEVFWRGQYERNGCGDLDFVVYREVETPIPDCLTIHSLQGVSTTTMRGIDGEFGFRNTSKILVKAVAHPHKPRGKVEYEKFCSFMVRYNSTSLAYMFNHTKYDTDAFVRHMFFLQLSEYKPCERVTDCRISNPYKAFRCMVGYKFHITMENTLMDGYVSEKLFNGALGGGIPIYFGASDIGKYVNKKSFIHCDVSRKVIDEMRSFYPRSQQKRPRPFLFKNSSSWPTDEELLSWADKYLRPQLDPCVKRVVELDSNDEDFMSVLNEPFILNKDMMSGAYPLRGVALAYNLLTSLDTGNDFVTVPGNHSTDGEEEREKKKSKLWRKKNERKKEDSSHPNNHHDNNNGGDFKLAPLPLPELPSPCHLVGASSSSEEYTRANTAISFVFAGRNDNYVGIYDRARLSLGVLLGQLDSILAKKNNNNRAEILIVSWGNDPSRASLFDEIVIPAARMYLMQKQEENAEVEDGSVNNSSSSTGRHHHRHKGGLDNVCIRTINVPPSHVLPADRNFPFSEFVAKNVAIRRAKGRRIAVTNMDNFFSNNLVRMAVFGRSSSGSTSSSSWNDDDWFVRAMRFNIDIKEGSVWWEKLTKKKKQQGGPSNDNAYKRVPSLKKPVGVSSVLDWMEEDGEIAVNSLNPNGNIDGQPIPTSALEASYAELHANNHLGRYARFDRLCEKSNNNQQIMYTALFDESSNTNNSVNNTNELLFGNAAGDYTLASISAWYNTSGYPEVYDNNHLDGLQLCRFHQAGYKQVVLRPTMPCTAFVFHQRHEFGRGGRKERNVGKIQRCAKDAKIEERLKKFVNWTGWGHGSEVFEEEVLTFDSVVSKSPALASSLADDGVGDNVEHQKQQQQPIYYYRGSSCRFNSNKNMNNNQHYAKNDDSFNNCTVLFDGGG
ncbi:hypothetical protein ACHAXR_007973 [Thalassiosira sp. AJA248-18]